MYTTEEVLLEVEVSDGWSGALKSLEDLDGLLHDLQSC